MKYTQSICNYNVVTEEKNLVPKSTFKRPVVITHILL